MNNKIAILLPYKDHYTNTKAGSASIWIKDFNKNSFYRSKIYVCGYTDNIKGLIDKNNYINLNFKTTPFKSKNLSYVDEFIKINNSKKVDLVEIHNRPSYVNYLI